MELHYSYSYIQTEIPQLGNIFLHWSFLGANQYKRALCSTHFLPNMLQCYLTVPYSSIIVLHVRLGQNRCQYIMHNISTTIRCSAIMQRHQNATYAEMSNMLFRTFHTWPFSVELAASLIYVNLCKMADLERCYLGQVI